LATKLFVHACCSNGSNLKMKNLAEKNGADIFFGQTESIFEDDPVKCGSLNEATIRSNAEIYLNDHTG